MTDEKLPEREHTQPIVITTSERSSTRARAEEAGEVLELTLARMKEENEKTLAALQESTARLLTESERSSELLKKLSIPPQPPDEEKKP